MFKTTLGVLAAAAVFFAANMARAQGVEMNVKTPPMYGSETITIPVAIHPRTATNWAGAIMQIHILDDTEVDFPGFAPYPLPTPPGPYGVVSAGFPLGANSTGNSQVATVTLIHPSAPASGIPITSSVNIPLGNLQVHAKGSTGQNSDVDANLRFWNIFHVPEGPGSSQYHFKSSDLIWVSSNIQDIGQLHIVSSSQGIPGPFNSMFRFPTNPLPLGDPNGHWLHIEQTSIVFHTFPGPGSNYFATFLNTATLGIEHVPEPAAAVLMVAGVGCAVAGRCFRRRRQAPVA